MKRQGNGIGMMSPFMTLDANTEMVIPMDVCPDEHPG